MFIMKDLHYFSIIEELIHTITNLRRQKMENNYPFTPTEQDSVPLTPIAKMHIEKMHKDMRFVSIFTIIFGVLACLTIFGAFYGIPMLIAGLRLKDSAEAYNYFGATKAPHYFEQAIEKQKSYFFIQKIMIIIMLVVIVLEIIAVIIFFSLFMKYFSPDMIRSV